MDASGTGKTHLAAALGHWLIEQNVRCKLFPAVALVQLLQQAKRDLDLMTVMSRLDKYRVVIIDDIGYVKKTDAETQVLFEFIAHRYESGSALTRLICYWTQAVASLLCYPSDGPTGAENGEAHQYGNTKRNNGSCSSTVSASI